MKLKSPLIQKIAGLSAATFARLWMNTLEWKTAMYDPSVDPLHPDCRGQKLFLFWHEYILAPLALRGHTNLAMLLSQHRDAEIIGRAAKHLGFETVRGSTSRGGTAALRDLLRRSRHMHLAIVPDGPRGPRRTMSLGPIYLSSKLQMPLVLMGLGYDQPWRANSWDKFAVPRPFSRARAVLSPELYLPESLDRDGLEHYRVQMERMLNRLTLEAEAWTESGTRKLEEKPLLKGAAPRLGRRINKRHPLAGPHSSLVMSEGWE
jgi:lysophospholipid acyltransferase (LPLAT)-like uncharacterized protein